MLQPSTQLLFQYGFPVHGPQAFSVDDPDAVPFGRAALGQEFRDTLPRRSNGQSVQVKFCLDADLARPEFPEQAILDPVPSVLQLITRFQNIRIEWSPRHLHEDQPVIRKTL